MLECRACLALECKIYLALGGPIRSTLSHRNTILRGNLAMKNLILIRHAKSSWNDVSLDDRERPLGKRCSSTRRFIARPCSVSLLAAGSEKPKPLLVKRLALTPCLVK